MRPSRATISQTADSSSKCNSREFSDPVSTKFRFRLVFKSRDPGVFAYDSETATAALVSGPELTVVARDAEHLVHARTAHLEAGGFPSEESARAAGERLRLRLRILSAMLGLGLHVPIEDQQGSATGEELKAALLRDHNSVAMDSVFGLNIFPDDGRHFEYVASGGFAAVASEPDYIFRALESLWSVEVSLDPESEDALRILGLAAIEPSPKTAFLATFLALEPLVPRRPRSRQAVELIRRFQSQLEKASHRKRAPLGSKEMASLKGAIAALREESFNSALSRLATQPGFPVEIQGQTTKKLFSESISARNKIAHRAKVPDEAVLNQLSLGLARVALLLIWSRTKLPNITVNVPPTTIRFGKEKPTIRVR